MTLRIILTSECWCIWLKNNYANFLGSEPGDIQHQDDETKQDKQYHA